MVCPECKIDARITKTKMILNTAEGKVYRLKTYSCQNKSCPNFNQTIGQEKDEVPVVVEDQEQ